MPLTCPQPPDCPLYAQRLAGYAEDEPLRRAILIERRNVVDLAALVRAEVRPEPAPQAALASGQPLPLPSVQNQKKETPHE